MKNRIFIIVTLIILPIISLGISYHSHQEEQKAHLRQQTSQEQKKKEELNNKLIEEQQAKQLKEEEVKTKDSEIQKRDVEIIDLKKRVEAKAQAKLASATKTSPASSVRATGGSSGYCGDNVYKQFIYRKESGCVTDRWNSSGCYGIGQACPASKIAHCGADFACQDAWFSAYAQRAYGGWAQAYSAWLRQGWW